MPHETCRGEESRATTGGKAEVRHIELVLSYSWECVECVPGERYTYPAPFPAAHPAGGAPAVYRWNIFRNAPDDIKTCYIGEAAALRRRITYCIKPGPTQHTNIRLAEHFRQHIASGGQICLEVMLLHPSVHGGIVVDSDALGDTHLRRAMEQLLIRDHTLGGWRVLNK